jgi:hypothetical protein
MDSIGAETQERHAVPSLFTGPQDLLESNHNQPSPSMLTKGNKFMREIQHNAPRAKKKLIPNMGSRQ